MKLTILPWIYIGAILTIAGCRKSDELQPTAENDISVESSLPHVKQFSGDVANQWYRLLTEITRIKPYAPPQTLRIFAYTGMSLYESLVPGMPSYQSMYNQLTGLSIPVANKKDYYWPAVANAAVAKVSKLLMAGYGANPYASAIDQLESDFRNEFALLITPQQLQRSIEYGQLVATKIYEWSQSDGALVPCAPYVPLGGPGNWAPTPPGFFPAAGACQSQVRTFLQNVILTTRPPAPPAYSTAAGSPYYEMMNEVYQLNISRTAEDIIIGEAWRDLLGVNLNTPSHVLRLTTQILAKEESNLEEAALIYVQQGMAMIDAVGSTFGAKFHYATIRPITYIRGVLGHTTWNSQYNTIQHPSYPAVAPSAAAAGLVILKRQFGNNYAFTDSTQHSLYGTWEYSSFDDLINDVERSRTHTGLNFRLSVEAGALQGTTVGEMIADLPFKKP